MNIQSKICWCCNGDRHHPMAPHPRTSETVEANPCPVCDGWGIIVETGYPVADFYKPLEGLSEDA